MTAVENTARVGHDGSGAVAPLSIERVRRIMDRHGWTYVSGEDARLGATFNGYPFYVLISGSDHNILQVRGRWSHAVEIERKPELLRLCNKWNMDRIWPKVYARREEEDSVRVYAEVSFDHSRGASDEQIDQGLRCGLYNALQFFEFLEDEYSAELEGDEPDTE